MPTRSTHRKLENQRLAACTLQSRFLFTTEENATLNTVNQAEFFTIAEVA